MPAIVAVAAAKGLCTILDNTWATPLFFPPHGCGVDLVVEAGTKYLSGHADLLLGLVSANVAGFRACARPSISSPCPGPEDVFLALRGLRSLELRLREAERQGLALATGWPERPEVARVLHPALPDCPGHAIWKRDFRGSSGLFSVFLKPFRKKALAAFLDGLKLFGMGYSWGGYESLVIPFDCSRIGRRPNSRRKGRRCASRSVSKIPTTSRPISWRVLSGSKRQADKNMRRGWLSPSDHALNQRLSRPRRHGQRVPPRLE